MHAISEIGIRELDRRSNDGLDVTLLWKSDTNQLFVAVVDERLGESFELEVDPANALDAFRHPYAYSEIHHNVTLPRHDAARARG